MSNEKIKNDINNLNKKQIEAYKMNGEMKLIEEFSSKEGVFFRSLKMNYMILENINYYTELYDKKRNINPQQSISHGSFSINSSKITFQPFSGIGIKIGK